MTQKITLNEQKKKIRHYEAEIKNEKISDPVEKITSYPCIFLNLAIEFAAIVE